MANAPSILVIDDEQGILETLRILLKNEGFDVTTAQGGTIEVNVSYRRTPIISLRAMLVPTASSPTRSLCSSVWQ